MESKHSQAPHNMLRCCIHGKRVPLHAASHSVELLGGQQLVMCGSECASNLTNLSVHLRHPNNVEYTVDDCPAGTQFLPSVALGNNTICPCCSSEITISETTPRIVMRYGQTIFFYSYNCINLFLKKPMKYFKKFKPKTIHAMCCVDREEVIGTNHSPTVDNSKEQPIESFLVCLCF